MLRAATVFVLLTAAVLHAGEVPDAWKTYRSESFGWELSHPPEMELKAYFGGASAQLRDARSGAVVAELEIWPADQCPRERPGTTAEALGTERVATVTQADGADGSSSCGAPTTVRRFASRRDVPLYEVRLTCRSERIAGRRTRRRTAGRKGPTFFADVSQPWRTRVLTVDPAGVDPRLPPPAHPPDVGAVRDVLATLATFPLPAPSAVCIEDLPGGAARPAAAQRRP